MLSPPPSPGVTSQLCHSNLSRPNSALGRGGIRNPVSRGVALANQRLRPLGHRGSSMHSFKQRLQVAGFGRKKKKCTAIQNNSQTTFNIFDQMGSRRNITLNISFINIYLMSVLFFCFLCEILVVDQGGRSPSLLTMGAGLWSGLSCLFPPGAMCHTDSNTPTGEGTTGPTPSLRCGHAPSPFPAVAMPPSLHLLCS